jgi:hypothetical protein
MKDCPGRRPGDLPFTAAIVLALLAGLDIATHQPARAAELQPLEYQVKAAFLLNFTKFVEWPPSAFLDSSAPISVCIVGSDPFGGALDQIVHGENVNSHKVVVQRVSAGPVPKSCNVVFLGNLEKHIPEILAGLDPGVLTVGDSPDFLREGGVIAFVIENRKVRFEVNQTAAEKAGIKLSSKLLSVARSVER